MKPYVICHMGTSVDARIQPRIWPKTNFHKVYEKCHETFKSDAWLVGRTTMEEHFSSKKIRLGKPDATIKKIDFIGSHNSKTYAIVIDPSGKCRWNSNMTDTEHIIEVLTENVSTAYLSHLQEKQVSYIFAGKSEIDLKVALKKLGRLFGIRRLMLEGGGGVNGSFLKAGLIDELSQLILPIADGTVGAPTLFDVEPGYSKRRAKRFRLKSVTRMSGGIVWLKYLSTSSGTR